MAVVLSRKGGGSGGGGAPSGPAGGDLAGTYPNPTLDFSVMQPVGVRVEIPVFQGEVSNTNWATVIPDGTVLDQAFPSRESTGAQNATITYKVLLAAGTWTLHLITFKLTNAGIYTVAIDAVSQGTIDGYAAANDANVLLTLANMTVTSDGLHDFRFTMATKNGSSASYFGDLQNIVLERTA